MAEAPFDEKRAQRWYGVEFNNLAWDLWEKNEKTCAEQEQMVHAAHASYLHWSQVGTPVNHLRGLILLTHVYCQLEYADAALRYAKRALELSEQAAAAEQTAFDLATTYEGAARAYACNGDVTKARELKKQAVEHAGKIEDADEIKLFQQFLEGGNWHGID